MSKKDLLTIIGFISIMIAAWFIIGYVVDRKRENMTEEEKIEEINNFPVSITIKQVDEIFFKFDSLKSEIKYRDSIIYYKDSIIKSLENKK